MCIYIYIHVCVGLKHSPPQHYTSHSHTQSHTQKERNKMKGNNPYLVVILIQAIYAAMFLLSKAAFDHGMNNFIFVFYRQAIATIFLTPFTFFFEWYVEMSLIIISFMNSTSFTLIPDSNSTHFGCRKTAPPMPFWTFCKIFFLSFFGYVKIFNWHNTLKLKKHGFEI